MRWIVAAVLALLTLSCRKSETAHQAEIAPAVVKQAGNLTIAGPGRQLDLPDGGTATQFGAVALPNDLSQAPGVVTVHLQGVTADPGSVAEFFLTDQRAQINPADYIGSIATMQGNPTQLGEMILEVNDFEADGQKYTARTTLRGQAQFGVAMVVKQGHVKVDRLVLMVAPAP